MRGQIHPVPEDLRLDFIRKQEIDDEEANLNLPDIKKRHPRLYKNTRRDHDMSELDDPHIVELMRKGTIPPSLSLRAPPTHIGTSNHRNDVIGISKEEISKRYIIKLRKDRARNNEAVYKSLDNLPIKIRQVAQKSLLKSAGTDKSSSSTVRSKLSSRSLPQSSTDREPKPSDPPWMKNNAMNPRKQRAKLKTLPKVDVNGAENEQSKGSAEDFFNVSFEQNSFSSEMPYVFSTGFQGYQNRVRFSKKKPVVAFGKTMSTSNAVFSSRENNDHQSNNSHEFQRRYQRVLDSNQQPHFVKTSLIKGQSVAHGYNKIKHILGVTENDHREELFAIKSVQRINQPTIFTSPASPTRVPNPSLYSEGRNSEFSMNMNDGAISPGSRGGSSTLADVDSRENSVVGDGDNVRKSENRKDEDTNNTEVPKLSLELLRVHENTTSAQAKKTHAACNLTDITERDESNLTKTSKSELGTDMKISVRINYKSKEDAIEEHHSTISASSVKSRETLTPKTGRHNESSESRRSVSNVSHSPLDNIRVQGRVYGEIPEPEERLGGNLNRGSVDRHRSLSSDEENEMPMIVVDLKNLQTVKTPQKKKRKINKNGSNGSEEAKLTTSSLQDHTNDKSETVESEKTGDFFLTYEDTDSPISHYGDTLVKSFKREDNVYKKDATPRTEVDDSGISISTYENETIKC